MVLNLEKKRAGNYEDQWGDMVAHQISQGNTPLHDETNLHPWECLHASVLKGLPSPISWGHRKNTSRIYQLSDLVLQNSCKQEKR